MNINKYSSLRETIVDLQNRSFNNSFYFKNQKLNCLQTKRSYLPKDIQIVEYHRFNDTVSDLETVLIVAIECLDGEKGYIISAENTVENVKLLQFMDKTKIKLRKNRILARKNQNS